MKMEERGRRMKGRGTHRNGGKMLENRGMDRRKVYENGGKMLKDGGKVCENRGKVRDNGIMLTLIPTGMAIYGSRHFKALFLKKPSSMKNLKKIANPGELFLVCF
jgi:hypothetical protein